MAKKQAKTLSDADIVSAIAKKTQNAVGFCATAIANKQEEALRLYNREPLPGDSKIKGKSKFVDSSVLEHTSWLKASVARVFGSTDKVVEFLPTGPEDEAIARQQTSVANFIATVQNTHETYFSPWTHNAILTGLGVVAINFDRCHERGLPQVIKGVTEEQLVGYKEQEDAGEIQIEQASDYQKQPELPPEMQQALEAAKGNPQVLEALKTNPQLAQAAAGILQPQTVYDLKIRKLYKDRKFTISSVAPEDFIVSKDADFDPRTGGIKAALQGHKRIMSRQDLIAQKFDREKVEKIPSAHDDNTGIANERSKPTDYEQGVNDVNDDVQVYEIFTMMKIEGDEPNHYRITLAGDLENNPVLLQYEEVTKYYPYAALCPFPIPNTLFGHGIADRIGEDQTLLSKIQRMVFDNLNQSINPIKVINPDVTKMDDALNLFPGSVIRSESPDAGINFLTTPFTAAQAMPVMDSRKKQMEFTTGVGGNMMAPNASDIQNTTATATSVHMNQAQTIVEEVCRHFAATGYRYMFKVIVDLLMLYPEDAERLTRRLTNNFIPPDQYNPEFDVKSNVAFGVMNKDFNAAMLNQILAMVQSARATGAYWITDANIHAIMSKIIENGGEKNVASFISDPASTPKPPEPPQPPDPNAGLVEIEKIKAQLKSQSDEREHQRKVESDQREADFQWRKFIAENDFKRDEMAQQLEIARAEIEAKYGAQLNIARLQMEQNAPRQ